MFPPAQSNLNVFVKRKPFVGARVYYQAYGTPGGEYPSVPRAATITEVGENGVCGLCVLNPTGLFFNREIHYSETPKPGCWSWMPEEVE